MMVLKLLTIGMDLFIFQQESLVDGNDKLDESTLCFHYERIRLGKSCVLIMPLVCCVTWHAKTTNELVVEMVS